MVSALILIAQGTEEAEYSITYDVLVRGGVTVQSALVGSSSQNPDDPHGAKYVECSRGVKIVPDLRLPDLAGGKALEYDAIVVPGGARGADTISNNVDVQKLISAMYANAKVVACICAGSLAAKRARIGTDNAITSHPSVKPELSKGKHKPSLRPSVRLLTSPLPLFPA
jgi:protein DJ-1